MRTDAEWTKLWQQHAPDRPRPAVDFSKEMVVGVFMGSRPNAGFSIAITSATAANGALIVRYSGDDARAGRRQRADPDVPVPPRRDPKAEVKDVKFESSVIPADCRSEIRRPPEA